MGCRANSETAECKGFVRTVCNLVCDWCEDNNICLFYLHVYVDRAYLGDLCVCVVCSRVFLSFVLGCFK